MTQYEKSWRATTWSYDEEKSDWKFKSEMIITSDDPLEAVAKLFPEQHKNNKVINQFLSSVLTVYVVLSKHPVKQTIYSILSSQPIEKYEYLLVLVRC